MRPARNRNDLLPGDRRKGNRSGADGQVKKKQPVMGSRLSASGFKAKINLSKQTIFSKKQPLADDRLLFSICDSLIY
jgi:hypothetical protein